MTLRSYKTTITFTQHDFIGGIVYHLVLDVNQIAILISLNLFLHCNYPEFNHNHIHSLQLYYVKVEVAVLAIILTKQLIVCAIVTKILQLATWYLISYEICNIDIPKYIAMYYYYRHWRAYTEGTAYTRCEPRNKLMA